MSDPILHLSSWQSPVFLLNSRLGRFSAALIFILERLFSRSYETILPSSLTTIHSSALGYSPRLPVSVYGTVCCVRYFLEENSMHYHAHRSVCVLSYIYYSSTYYSVSTQHLHFSVALLRAGTGILTRFPSASPFGYTLGSD